MEDISVSEVLAAAQCRKQARLLREAVEETVEGELARIMRRQLRAVLPKLWPQAKSLDGEELLGAPEESLLDVTLRHQGVRVRIGVLEPGRLVDVRASSRLRDRYLRYCAVALWAARGQGLDIAAVDIANIDTGFVYRGDGNYQGLLRRIDVTKRVQALLPEVPGWVAEARAARENWEVAPGPHCRQPQRCDFIPLCSPVTAQYPVSELNPGRGLQARLAEANIDDIREMPSNWLTKPRQRMIHAAAVSGAAQLSPTLVEFLRALPYPRYYLDFEAVQFAVPIWPGTRPLRALPFQWSLLRESAPGEIEHRDYLNLEAFTPPMRPLAEALLQALGQEGPILVYGGYENKALANLAALYPDLGEALSRVAARTVDLLPHIKSGYYHRDMHGGASLKAVLPTLGTALSYKALEGISEGVQAQLAYLEAIAPETEAARREELAAAMLAYCRLDTEVLAEMVIRLAEPPPEAELAWF